MQKVFGLLYKATRHWFNKIVGNPLTTRTIERVRVERRDIGEKLLSTQLVGRLQPIGDLQQKNAILAYLQTQQDIRIKNEKQAQIEENMKKMFEETLSEEQERYRRHSEQLLSQLSGLKDYAKTDFYSTNFCGTSKAAAELREEQQWKYWNLALITNGSCWVNAPWHQIKTSCVILAAAFGILLAVNLLASFIAVIVTGAIGAVSSLTNRNADDYGGNDANEDQEEGPRPLLDPNED